MIINNEITIKYKINNQRIIRIFGEQFVRNNKGNYQIIFKEKIYDLSSEFTIRNIEIEDNTLEIKLKQIKNVSELSYMFSECTSLISISDISNWKIQNVTSLSAMFSQCISLISLPDISNWNTMNVKNE